MWAVIPGHPRVWAWPVSLPTNPRSHPIWSPGSGQACPAQRVIGTFAESRVLASPQGRAGGLCPHTRGGFSWAKFPSLTSGAPIALAGAEHEWEGRGQAVRPARRQVSHTLPAVSAPGAPRLPAGRWAPDPIPPAPLGPRPGFTHHPPPSPGSLHPRGSPGTTPAHAFSPPSPQVLQERGMEAEGGDRGGC